MSTLEEVNTKANELITFIARETIKDCEECSALETSKDDDSCELYDEMCCLCLIDMEKHVNDIKATVLGDDANTRMDSLKNKFTEKVNRLVTALDDMEIANEELKEENARYKKAYEQMKKRKDKARKNLKDNEDLKHKLNDAILELKYKNMEIRNLEAAAEDMMDDHKKAILALKAEHDRVKKELDVYHGLHDTAMREVERLRSFKRGREM